MNIEIEQNIEKLNSRNIGDEEKYNICYELFKLYKDVNIYKGLYYLVESEQYNKSNIYKIKCILELILYCFNNNKYEIAELYIRSLERYYIENKMEESYEAYFVLPYHVIIICDRTGNAQLAINIYKYSFTKIFKNVPQYMIGNYMYNLQFYLDKVKKTDIYFFELVNKYINNLEEAGYNVRQYDFVSKYSVYGIKLNNMEVISKYTEEECRESKNILIYTGYMPYKWNYTYSLTNALGGSETAAAYLANMLPKEYTIYVAGHVEEESYDNIIYVHNDNLKGLIEKTLFYTIIVSRYIDFYEQYPTFSAYRTYIWGHDIFLFSQLNTVDNIINKWSKKINGCICQTEWHKNQLLSVHGSLNNIKLYTINNGIDINLIDNALSNIKKKVPNRFIYSSCSERGLEKLLQIWPQIINALPDAELFIASYNKFPSSELDYSLKVIIDKYSSSITHVGKLTKKELYSLMSSSEYWLYPTCFDETSCITAMELLANEVICIYYPRAGLVDTIGEYGIQIKEDNELEKILELTEEDKISYREKGRKYAEEVCNWSSRIKEWKSLIWGIDINNQFYRHFKDLELKAIFPEDHINYLKQLSNDFQPMVIYDIGACVLKWAKIAKDIWKESEIILFEAMDEVEDLYKEYNYRYNIGVITDIDNKQIEFYQNNNEPGGNSYYKEIGHSKSHILFNESNKKYKNGMSLQTIVKTKDFKLPNLVKIDVQGAELDILKGGMNIINNAKYLIIELQRVQYNEGAPLANEVINYLENNGWKLITKDPFCNNGPDGDYCFINNKYNKDKWLFILPFWFHALVLIDYLDSLKSKYNIDYIKIDNSNNNLEEIKKYNPNKITFILGVYNNISIVDYAIKNNIEISMLNTEPLTLRSRLNEFKETVRQLSLITTNFKVYDYSKSNIKLLNDEGIKNTEHLSYQIYEEENKLLIKLYKETPKIYDFGFIGEIVERRKDIIEYIKNNTPYTVNIIEGWKEERDKKLAECRVILNIHGWYNEPTNIFEHIRCDRLLEAGFRILSEESYELDPDFQKKYSNLHIIKYKDFFNSNILNNIMAITVNDVISNINKKIIDCFTFYNELDLLEYRLNVLNDVVDYFVIVEANQTHAGKQKELYYNNNKERFYKFKDKIIHIIVDLPCKGAINIQNNEQWVNEKYQRNCISLGLDKININNNDVIIISDLDEIPDPNTLINIKNNTINININRLEMDLYYYNLHNRHLNKWYHSKILLYKKYKELNIKCDDIRFYNCNKLEKGGWHLSYFGSAEFIKNKIEQFSHQELNLEEFTNIAKIQYRINNNMDLYNRPNDKTEYISIKNNTYLPPLYDYFLTKFYKTDNFE